PHGDLVRRPQMLGEPERRVAIEVCPAAPEPHRALNRPVVEANRGVFPVLIEPLVAQPDLRPEALRLEPLEPHLAPALAHDLRIRRPRVEELHDAAPPEVVVEQCAARIVYAFGEAVI